MGKNWTASYALHKLSRFSLAEWAKRGVIESGAADERRLGLRKGLYAVSEQLSNRDQYAQMQRN